MKFSPRTLHFAIIALMSVGIFFGLFVTSTQADTIPVATGFRYPVDDWTITVHQGDAIGPGYYHMGIDAGFGDAAGTPVYAITDGIVREAQERSQFGLVVLIEHLLPNGKTAVSLYGHLDPTDVRVHPGDVVRGGDVIGVMGSESNNGGWAVHLHFGIYKAAYTGAWVYYGHVSDPATAEQWYNPETFLPNWIAKNGTISVTSTAPTLGVGLQRSGRNRQARLQTFTTTGETDTDFTSRTQSLVGSIHDVAVGPVLSTDSTQIVVVGNHEHQTIVNILNADGGVKRQFTAFHRSQSGGARVATGDVDGDGDAEIIVSAGRYRPNRIRLFEANGSLIGDFHPGPQKYRGGLDLATGDVDGDGDAEIIIGQRRGKSRVSVVERDGTVLQSFRPFEKTYHGGVNLAAGDVNGDGRADLIIGSDGHRSGEVRVILSLPGETLYDPATARSYNPFGTDMHRAVDVSTVDWEADGSMEIMMSIAGRGSNALKVYRYDKRQHIVFEGIIGSKKTRPGLRIAGWPIIPPEQ